MAIISVDYRYRFKRSGIQEERMKYLTEKKVFTSYSQILMVSAILGYNFDKFDEVKKTGSDTVQITFFTEENYHIMHFLAYARAKEQKVLTEGQDKYTIFEGYANAGFEILWKSLDIEWAERENYARLDLLKKYYRLLLTNGFCE